MAEAKGGSEIEEALLRVQMGPGSSVPVARQWEKELSDSLFSIHVVRGRTDLVAHVAASDIENVIFQAFWDRIGPTLVPRSGSNEEGGGTDETRNPQSAQKTHKPRRTRALQPMPVDSARAPGPDWEESLEGDFDASYIWVKVDHLEHIRPSEGKRPEIRMEDGQPSYQETTSQSPHISRRETLLQRIEQEIEACKGIRGAAWEIDQRRDMVVQAAFPKRMDCAHALQRINSLAGVFQTYGSTILPSAVNYEVQGDAGHNHRRNPTEACFFIDHGLNADRPTCNRVESNLAQETGVEEVVVKPLLGGPDAICVLKADPDTVARKYWNWMSRSGSGWGETGFADTESSADITSPDVRLYLLRHLMGELDSNRLKRNEVGAYVQLRLRHSDSPHGQAEKVVEKIRENLRTHGRERLLRRAWWIENRHRMLVELSHRSTSVISSVISQSIQHTDVPLRQTDTFLVLEGEEISWREDQAGGKIVNNVASIAREKGGATWQKVTEEYALRAGTSKAGSSGTWRRSIEEAIIKSKALHEEDDSTPREYRRKAREENGGRSPDEFRVEDSMDLQTKRMDGRFFLIIERPAGMDSITLPVP